MNVIPTAIPDVLIIEPRVFGDQRGFFFESFHRRQFAERIGRNVDFVQDNHSRSVKNVLRGLQLEAHGYQVNVTELVGWEHSMKNELIVARKHEQANRRAAERLQEILQTLGLEELKERFS